MDDDFVTVRHPDIQGDAQVVRAALPFMEPKGWQVVDDATAAPSEPPPGAPDATPTPPPAPNLLES